MKGSEKKGYGQQDIGIYRTANIANPAVVKQDHEFSVGNTVVRHFVCNTCRLPFTMYLPPRSTENKTMSKCPNCYTEQVS